MARQERIRLPSSTSEKLEVTIEADADPTGATVAFNVTSGEDYDDPDPGDGIVVLVRRSRHRTGTNPGAWFGGSDTGCRYHRHNQLEAMGSGQHRC